MKFQADQLKEGNDKICYLGDDLDMTELRHFVNFALEEKRGENCPRPVRKCEWGILFMFWGARARTCALSRRN